MLQIPLAVVVVLLLITASRNANAQAYRTEAQNMINTLNPTNRVLGSLIDSANGDMRDRLEQLRGIIDGALVNLDQLLKDETIRLNADGEGRLKQLDGDLRANVDLINGLASGTIKQIDDAGKARIDQSEKAFDQLLESLPVPMQPLPKPPDNGYALWKPLNRDYALLYISGAGLMKGGTKPEAYFMNGDGTDHHPFRHDGTELCILSSSMGLVVIKIPKNLFPASGQIDRSIQLKVASGNYLPGSVQPSFQLLMCASAPKYTASVELQATGWYWKQRTVDYQPYTQPEIKQVNIDDGGSHQEKDICASDVNIDGWVPDPSVNAPSTNPRVRNALYGLEYQKADAHAGNLVANFPKAGCLHIYAERDKNGGGFAEATGIIVHQRKLFQGACGSKLFDPKPLQYGLNTIDADPKSFDNSCIPASDGAPSSATIRTRLTITSDSDKNSDVQDLRMSSALKQPFEDDNVQVTMNDNGLIRLKVKPACKQEDINVQ